MTNTRLNLFFVKNGALKNICFFTNLRNVISGHFIGTANFWARDSSEDKNDEPWTGFALGLFSILFMPVVSRAEN